ncbi:hypothetical protein RhiirC2_782996 [Rhizophagus irregularis]|uniref:Uncharacterized protein n=1 Tax=Rhizophagus irregularis TaxID=588596 RepID=A0A2N1N1Y1_9GLOM|nr:hypothetical protein RhiirC2_782996 [Rhizophagus irregularis]
MSTYTELASISNSTDSTSEEVIYEASHVVSDETVLKIIRALKDTIFVARKLFPDNKIVKICELYKNKQVLLDKLEALFELYYNVTKDLSTGPLKQAIIMNKAENTLAELFA